MLPSSRWRSGEYLQQRFELTVPRTWEQGGEAVLGLRVRASGGGGWLSFGEALSGGSDPDRLMLTRVPVAANDADAAENEADIGPADADADADE